MLKRATYQYSDVLRDKPHDKMLAGTITAAPSKGQRNNPLKYSDVPVETKRTLRKMNIADLTRAMERAGGYTSTKGRQYAAVLEERGVNPNLSGTNPSLARQVSNDMYKKAMYDAFAEELSKIANKQDLKIKDYGFTSLGAAAPAAAIGGALGAGAGIMGGTGLAGKAIAGTLGGLAGATLGAGFGYGQMKKTPLVKQYAQAMDKNRGSSY